MKNILKLSILLLFSAAFFSCSKSDSYNITHRYTYFSTDLETGNIAPAPMLNYLISYDLVLKVSGDGENERDSKAKSKFQERFQPFTQEELQAKLEEVLADSTVGEITVRYYLYRANQKIDSTELYTASKGIIR
ncbi:MAG: hypothetical protein LBR45_05100 [Bacteroidales bacterium]|nr:hypothetical protein [Bacteroidales bacterium]